MARKTKQEAQETRQHILDVALRLFSQQGVSSTSLGEIAKAAGVTRGAIYWHFKDKSDLFSEIWELSVKWFTEFGHLNRGDMLTSEQHRCHNEKKKFQRRV